MTLTFLALALAPTAAARADGSPAGVVAGPEGVTTPQADIRWVTVGDGHSTVVEAIAKSGGRVVRWSTLRGDFEVPGVTVNGAGGGLTADGRTLVLLKQTFTFPQRHTTLALYDTSRMTAYRRIRLKGVFGFDAVSSNGGSVYLIQYLSNSDPTRYAVRAYDVSSGRLRSKPIVDPNEHGDEMRGFPLSRAYSRDGRWAYTLYDGNGKHPFVHALDTIAGTAKCIDVPLLAGRRDLQSLGLTATSGGRTLSIAGKKGLAATVDTRTFRVRPPAPLAAAAESGRGAGGAGPWPILAFAGVLLAAATVALRLRRRRRLAPS